MLPFVIPLPEYFYVDWIMASFLNHKGKLNVTLQSYNHALIKSQ